MTDVLVIGAGPYGLATAKAARERGLSTVVVGRPMSFWREHMPAGMFLRSGPDWHMDPANELTLERYLGARGVRPDPLPLELFLDYADWFQRAADIEVREDEVTRLTAGWDATLASGETIRARAVVAAPGVAYFAHRPEWAPDGVHTCDCVDFGALAGARVLIVGGRQSAYEWAALLGEHGAARVDVVHRHPQPRFAKVSWRFVDEHVERTLEQPGYWRRLPQQQRDAIARQFWEVGRLTLEHWLAPRIEGVHVHANAYVREASAGAVTLSDGTRLQPDRIVFATGYQADLAKVPYLPPLPTPSLDAHMQSSLPGLYLPGFTATHDFGPFFGFVKGAPAAAAIVANHISTKDHYA